MTKYLKYISFVALFLASIFLVACQNQNSQTKERTRKQRPKDELVVSMGQSFLMNSIQRTVMESIMKVILLIAPY